MSWAQFRDTLCYLYLAAAVVASGSLYTGALNKLFKNIIYFKEFSENIKEILKGNKENNN